MKALEALFTEEVIKIFPPYTAAVLPYDEVEEVLEETRSVISLALQRTNTQGAFTNGANQKVPVLR
jgi:hypothetical protein